MPKKSTVVRRANKPLASNGTPSHQLAVRVSPAQLDRLEALRASMDARTPGVIHTLSDVIRVAVEQMHARELA